MPSYLAAGIAKIPLKELNGGRQLGQYNGSTAFLIGVITLMCVTWIGPSQGVRLRLGSMYIDVSFPRPSSAPYLDI